LQISEFREGGDAKAETRIAIFGFEGAQQELKVSRHHTAVCQILTGV
jgi:hypothetical protein